VFGRHTLRSGASWRLYQLNAYDLASSSGSFTFDSTYTRASSTSASAPIGQGFASFLYGIPSSGSFPINDNYAEQTRYWAFYSQDDWKVTKKLTLSLGLRYELPSPLTERFNRSVEAFNPAAALPIAAQVMQNYSQNPVPQVPVSQFKVSGGLTFAGVGGNPRTLWNTSKKEFMPRIGFAYSLTPKTVIRGGYGIYYEPLGVVNIEANQTGLTLRRPSSPLWTMA
jgi:outer membrane receptor protein involved in Fe transport